MMNQDHAYMSLKTPPKGSSRGPATYHVFYFKTESPAVWLVVGNDRPIEFLPGYGWYENSAQVDYQHDILNCVRNLSASYEDLPTEILRILES